MTILSEKRKRPRASGILPPSPLLFLALLHLPRHPSQPILHQPPDLNTVPNPSASVPEFLPAPKTKPRHVEEDLSNTLFLIFPLGKGRTTDLAPFSHSLDKHQDDHAGKSNSCLEPTWPQTPQGQVSMESCQTSKADAWPSRLEPHSIDASAPASRGNLLSLTG